MTEGADGTRRARARMTGAVYLGYFLTAVLAQVLARRKLVGFGEALNVIANALYIVLTLLLYFMFRPVNRTVSLLAALCSVAGCAIALLGVFHLAPRHLSPLWFFGPYCLLIGILIIRSTFLPRVIGWLMAAAGLGWMAYLSPQVARHFALYVEVVGIVAEASLMVWLLVKGVDEVRWAAQAGTG